MKILLIVATAIAVIPVILSLFVKNMYLSDKYVVAALLSCIGLPYIHFRHNDVEDVDANGAPVDVEKA